MIYVRWRTKKDDWHNFLEKTGGKKAYSGKHEKLPQELCGDCPCSPGHSFAPWSGSSTLDDQPFAKTATIRHHCDHRRAFAGNGAELDSSEGNRGITPLFIDAGLLRFWDGESLHHPKFRSCVSLATGRLGTSLSNNGTGFGYY
jgi:hypothetical protein